MGVAACFTPKPLPGSPCDDAQPCPEPLFCSAITQTCVLEEPEIDAALPDSDPNAGCFGSGFVTVCPVQPSEPALVLDVDETIDTDVDVRCAALLPPGVTDVCALVAPQIRVMAAITAIGQRPLVLVASNLVLEGSISVASSAAGRIGAAANPACSGGTAPSGGGGGAGGSYRGTGGSGGAAGGGTPAPATPDPQMLRGGCSGGTGGGTNGGAGGNGGGVVYLIGDSIMIGGTINASGAGGSGVMGLNGGGGGGGAGGMIGLDATSLVITMDARVFANGGGGGGAASFLGSGAAGADPAEPLAAADGGSSSGGGIGGSGAIATSAATGGGGAGANGGGGGGACGVIKLFAQQQTIAGQISPAPN